MGDQRQESLEDEDSVADDSQEWEKRLADDPEYASRVFRAVEGLIPDILKRTLLTGLGSTLLNEDGLRSMLAEKKLPKEAMGLLMSQASGMRREVLRVISREIRIFLESMDFGGEISKVLTSLSFEIKTEIRFIPNDAAVKPNIRNRIKIKRTGEDGKEEEVGGDEEDVEDTSAAAPAAPPAAEPASRKLRWGLRPRADHSKDSER